MFMRMSCFRGAIDSMSHANTIISILSHQLTHLYLLFCRDCGFEAETHIPKTMTLESISCPGCAKRGLIVGHPLHVG